MEYKIVRHPKNEKVDQKVLLLRILEEIEAGETKGVVIITFDEDGCAWLRWSDMTHKDLTYGLAVADIVVKKAIIGED